MYNNNIRTVCPADHVPDWQPRVLLDMVEARSVNVKKTTTTTDSEIHQFINSEFRNDRLRLEWPLHRTLHIH